MIEFKYPHYITPCPLPAELPINSIYKSGINNDNQKNIITKEPLKKINNINNIFNNNYYYLNYNIKPCPQPAKLPK